MRTQSKKKQANPTEAREKAADIVVTGVSITSDWLRKWREVSGPIK